MTVVFAAIFKFLFQLTITIVWSLVLSKLIRSVIYPMFRNLWQRMPKVAIAWR